MKLLLAGLVALGVRAETVKLTIKVIDAVTQAGIQGAQLRMIQTAPPADQPFAPELVTDAGGVISVDAPSEARLRVTEIKAAGYAGLTASSLIVTEADPVSVTYSLTRTGTITGRIVDSDSGEPIAGVGVEPLLAGWSRGRRELQRALKSVITQKDGTFLLGDLRVGDYALDINSYSADGKHHPASGYPQIVWPGGGDFQSAAPVNLSYGAELSLGDIKLRKREFPKLTVTVEGAPCSKSQAYEVTLNQYSFSSSFVRGYVRAPCGETAVFAEVTPGDYEIEATAPWQKDEERQVGALPIQIGKDDEKITVAVTPPVAIHGRIRAEQDAALPTQLQVHLWARGSKSTGFSHVRSFLFKVDPDGSFEGRSYIPAGGEIQVDVSPLPPEYYVRQVSYDGLEAPVNVFVVHAGISKQQLIVTLSDRAATLSGMVRTSAGRIVQDLKVLLTRWPADVVADYPFGVEEATASPSGTYFYAHLRPGMYRAIAVSAAVRAKLEQPGVMLALFGSAESFEVGEGGSFVRNLSPVEVR